jgi:SAM-dependent methyltransferase
VHETRGDLPRLRVFDRSRFDGAASYVAYQKQITDRHLIPLFRQVGVPLDQPILDVGCGSGGCAVALGQALSVPITGIELDPWLAEAARAAADEHDVSFDVQQADVLEDELPAGPFGLILVRDVIEHVADPQLALTRLRPLVSRDGCLYVTFPPWWGPYAGHQHNAQSAARYLPYLHAVMPRLFLALRERLEGPDLADERQIAKNALTMRRFEVAARQAGWRIHSKQTYLFRPAFMRMGLPVLPNGWIGRVPWLGECLTTGCEYFLKPH